MAPTMSKSVAVGVAAALVSHIVRADEDASAVTPLQKVTELLNGMLAKGKDEKHTEEVEFAEFQQWCTGTREGAEKSIAEASAKITQLQADIEKASADAEKNGSEAAEYQATADAEQVELDKATAIRKKEKADYDATHADLSESIDAIERAIAVLKQKQADTPQSLLQVSDLSQLSDELRSSVENFLALSEEQTPAANAYEFQSGGVVEMLEKLRLKFQDELLALQKAEMASKGNYEVLKQKLTSSISDSKERASKRTATKAKKMEEAAKAKGDLEVTTKSKSEDEKELSETKAECSVRSEEFENNQVVRSEEIKAITKAVEILNSGAVSGNAEKHLPSAAAALVQDVSSLVQLRSSLAPEADEARAQALEFLQGRAKNLGSRILSMAASHVANDPLAKIKKIVKDMIVKLMEEANKEADQNAYCTSELAMNKMTREDKQEEVEELSAGVEKKTAESMQLAEELAALSEAVATIKQQQAEATKLRQEEKATNTATISDAQEAQVAVERATKVLKDFYGSQGGASFIQNGEDNALTAEMSQASSAPYTGMSGESGGVVGLLEVILSDFARLESETSGAESQAQEAYEKYMAEANQDVAVKETEINHKQNAKMDCDTATDTLKKELELTNEELSAALAYYEKLKPDCVDKGESYDVRVQKRQEEIESLQEALRVLGQQKLG
eukprot:TRINITY_DN1059_c0_g2_i1.p1 TRINITY_DN1059_c0_g2~~TRINITY_DN1059_c0_g2_i1.p1  ORF type:complete len:679 (+),score=335.60 TRINITY_DN1059_c0_g2_i1:67-2103(+)